MASRGRGRGRGSLNRNFFGGSDDALPPVVQPPPLYPSLKFKPVPLPSGKQTNYLLNLKREIRSSMRESGYYIHPASIKKDIDRYTDKYQQIQSADEIEWDKSLFPRELFEEPPKKIRKAKKKVIEKEVVEKLKVLEDKEDVEDNDENEENGEEIENEEEIDDEELEEETDYAQSYFDNGENYLEDEDDNLDEGYE